MVCGKAHLQVVIGLTLTWSVSLLLFPRAFVKRCGNDAPWKPWKSPKATTTFPPFPPRVEIQQKSPDFHISAAPTAAITSQLPKTLHIL
jgi:hypothetical protein